MSEHRYDIKISESCVDPNPLRVERQDPDNFPRLQTRERCALEIAAYVFKAVVLSLLIYCFMYLPLLVGVLCPSLFWYALLYVFSSFAIILTRKRELVALFF